MSAAGPSQGANRAPFGGSAAATAASVGVVIRAAGPCRIAELLAAYGSSSGDSCGVGVH